MILTGCVSTDLFEEKPKEMSLIMEGRIFSYTVTVAEGMVAKQGVNGFYAIRPFRAQNNWAGFVNSKMPFNIFSGVISLTDFRFTQEQVIDLLHEYESRRIMKRPISSRTRPGPHFSDLQN